MERFNAKARSCLKKLLMGNHVHSAPNEQRLQVAPQKIGGKIAFRNCSLFDGAHRHLKKEMTILVAGDTITAVGRAEKIPVPEGYFVVDTEGKTVLPGLIDNHVHLCSPFTYDVNIPAIRQMRKQIAFNNRRTLDSGVTTICDMGGPQGIIKEFNRLTDDNILPGPRSLNCFTLISPSRGKELGYPPQVKPIDPFQAWLLEGQIASRPKSIGELRKICYKVKNDGGNHLKTTYQSYPFSARKPPQANSLPLFDDDWMREIFRIGRDTGMVVSIHSPFAAGTQKCVDLAIAVGAQIRIEHVSFDAELDEPVMRKMHDHGFYLIPTLTVYGDAFRLPSLLSWLDNRPEGHLTEEAGKQIKARIQQVIDLEPLSGRTVMELDSVYFRRQFDIVKRNTQKAHAAGIIGFGTDLGGTYSGFFGRLLCEVQHYADCGISAADILQYLTSVNAKINNLNDRGTIQPGHLADIIVLEGDPFSDLASLGDVRAVMKGGVFLKYEGMGQA